MQLKTSITNLLDQLQFVIAQMTDEEYKKPIKLLSQSTIGQHTRHILEFFIELNKGYDNGIVDYDQRIRNHAIESNKVYALNVVSEITTVIEKPDRELLLNVDFGGTGASLQVFTNYFRELVYNLEHTVHHMAIIRIGVEAISKADIPAEFGIAASTLKYRGQCAQ